MTDNDRLVIIQFTSENKLNIIFCWLSVSLCCINGGMVSPLQFSSSDDLACFGAYYRLCRIKISQLYQMNRIYFFSRESDSRIANVRPLVSPLVCPSSIAQNALCLSESLLLTIEPIDRQAY